MAGALVDMLGAAIRGRGTEKALSPVSDRGGWWPIIREAFGGAWQRNIEIRHDSVLSFHAVFACQTLIASDIAKLRMKLVAKDGDGIWSETTNPAYSPVLRRPNHFQNRIQFFESWVLSKLQRGNTYVLKVRDNRGVVAKLYVLDPMLVKPLISDAGDVFYELNTDNLSGLTERVVVPAREIIHDRFNCLFHPLVGLSPIFANGLAATQGLAIQSNTTRLFENGARPGGLLLAPGNIKQENADRLKAHWESEYSGANAGRVAVLGDGLKFEPLAMNAVDAQLIEQLKWSAEVVCSTYHVPPYKIGVGEMPKFDNIQALNVEYYSQALQILMESIELCLDEGLSTGEQLGTEFDVANLLRMDSVTQIETIEKGVKAGVMAPNEGRRMLDLKPVAGGSSPYLQQQNYSLEALAKRDAREDPFASAGKAGGPSADAGAEPPDAANDNMEEQAAKALFAIAKGLR